MHTFQSPLRSFAAAILTLALASSAFAKTWEIDPTHSNVTFKVRHFFTPVAGNFSNFEGTIDFDPAKPETGKVEAKVFVDSIDTNDAKRDKHLMGEDFFTQDKYPAMTFTSTRWKSLGDNKFEVTGNLTILDKTLPVTLDTELLGSMDHPRKPGKQVSGWTAKTTIDRTEWGMNYGQGIVGNDVAIEINIEAEGQ